MTLIMKRTIKPVSVACIGECMVELTQADLPVVEKSNKRSHKNNNENENFLKEIFAGDTLNTAAYMARILKEASAIQIASESSMIFSSGITVEILPYESRKQLIDLLKTAKQ